jgi:hypothetical protein
MNVPMPPPSAPAPDPSGEPAPQRQGPPPWLVPAGIGVVIALLAVLIVVLLTRGDEEDSVAPATTVESVDSTVPATEAPTTVPETTEAPPTTVPETVPATTTPATEPPPVALTPGQATITADGTTSSYTVVVTCRDFWAGLETTSHVLVDDASGAVWVADVYWGEEGGPRGLAMVDMAPAIASDLFGQDTTTRSGAWYGTIDDGADGVSRSTVTLSNGDGPAELDVAIAEPAEPDDCAVGQILSTSPFVGGAQVEWLSPDDTDGQRFNVLAQCGGELLVSGGALLVSFYPEDGNTMIAFLSNTYVLTGEDVAWSNFVTPEPSETSFEQVGGGDKLAAINVFRNGDRSSEPGYLAWTERPLRSSVGAAGLLDEVCPGP